MFVIVDNGDDYSVSSLQYVLSMRGLVHEVLPREAPYDALPLDRLMGVFLSGGADNLDVRDPLLFTQVSLDVSCIVNCPVPVMGICFGFELIIAATGGHIIQLQTPPPSHCVIVDILCRDGIFQGLPPDSCFMEYNSLGALQAPASLIVTARSTRSPVEAVKHHSQPIFGTQFHPEARDAQGYYLPSGLTVVNNFIDICLSLDPPVFRA